MLNIVVSEQGERKVCGWSPDACICFILKHKDNHKEENTIFFFLGPGIKSRKNESTKKFEKYFAW